MKRMLLILLPLAFLAETGLAIEKLYHEKGYVIYKCTGRGASGNAKVRKLGDGGYLVFGGAYKGKVYGPANYAEAARKACGEDK